MVGVGTAVLYVTAVLVEVVVNAEISGFYVFGIHVERCIAPCLELLLAEGAAPNAEFVDLTVHVSGCSTD